jgi:hypothetical protein
MLLKGELGGLTFFTGGGTPFLAVWVESPVGASKRQFLGFGNDVEWVGEYFLNSSFSKILLPYNLPSSNQ